MQDKDRIYSHMAQTVASLQRAVTLARSGSTHIVVAHLQRSLTQLVSLQKILQLRLHWTPTPEQVHQQQERLARQQTRLQWQQTMLEQLRDEQER